MKLVYKQLESDKSGSISLIAEEQEDMWHTYNLLQKGDRLKASTIRRVVTESSTGSTDKSTHKITLTIAVEEVFFDVQVAQLRVNGRNVEENKFVKLGAYHTIDLELQRKFTITKDEWDTIDLTRIEEATDYAKRAEIAAVVLEEGLANVCLITETMTIVKQRIESSVPKKRRGTTTDHDKGMTRFYDQIVQAILNNIDFTVVKRQDNKTLFENRSKIMLIHSSSGHKHALGEMLQDPQVQQQLSETKYCQEVKSLQDFYLILGQDQSRAFYGIESANIQERKRYIQLVEDVKSMGGKALIFSALHTSGEQLSQLTGVAAILHYPMPHLEEEIENSQ
ncbi:eRF1 domain 1-domain-containing protein [Gorgonomyces haynaldii]|nr:eRF1 domain 1-domain-containing protein [Gorgonomyces haynaldii]